jgi:hypothetical protein
LDYIKKNQFNNMEFAKKILFLIWLCLRRKRIRFTWRN